MTTENHEDERRHDDNHPRRCLHARDSEHVRQVSRTTCVYIVPSRARIIWTGCACRVRDACMMLRVRYVEVAKIPEHTVVGRAVITCPCSRPGRRKSGKLTALRQERLRKRNVTFADKRHLSMEFCTTRRERAGIGYLSSPPTLFLVLSSKAA